MPERQRTTIPRRPSELVRRALVLWVSTLSVAATAALGCECQRTGDGSVDPANEMRRDLATERALFVGTVRAIEIVTNPPQVTEGQLFTQHRRITFDVEES